jgi:hypothetical protein
MDWIALGKAADRFGAVAVAVIAMFAAGIAGWFILRWLGRRADKLIDQHCDVTTTLAAGIVEVRSDVGEVRQDLRRLDRSKQIDELHALIISGDWRAPPPLVVGGGVRAPAPP